jgi:hypothetical protein
MDVSTVSAILSAFDALDAPPKLGCGRMPGPSPDRRAQFPLFDGCLQIVIGCAAALRDSSTSGNVANPFWSRASAARRTVCAFFDSFLLHPAAQGDPAAVISRITKMTLRCASLN